jgi:AcrR family transcriptional regulator
MRSTAKRKPPALTREAIAEAALAHIDAHGRAALSMRSLAAGVGVEAMSLYHHVAGIEDVLDLVVDRLLASLQVEPNERNPRQALHAYAKAYLALAEAHPNAFPLVATRLWHTPAAIALVGATVGMLRGLGLSQRAALRQARVLGAYLNGAGLALAAWRTSDNTLSGRAAANDAALAPLAGDVNAATVRADLEAGLAQLLSAIQR